MSIGTLHNFELHKLTAKDLNEHRIENRMFVSLIHAIDAYLPPCRTNELNPQKARATAFYHCIRCVEKCSLRFERRVV